jgi:hypothetical protein
LEKKFVPGYPGKKVKEYISILSGDVKPGYDTHAITIDVAHEVDLLTLVAFIWLVDADLVNEERQGLAPRAKVT